MSKQIVISGNRILAHGEDCFLAMGGTVICPDTGRVYQNATVATVDALPSDIDSVGYEYHAGEFIPCAPYGIGSGNLAVFCGEDCKALKDSGIPIGNFARYTATSYKGNGTYSRSLTFDFPPQLVIIMERGNNYFIGFMMTTVGVSFSSSGAYAIQRAFNVSRAQGQNTISWNCDSSTMSPFEMLNESGVTYDVYAVG